MKRDMEIIYSYPSPSNGWRRELSVMTMIHCLSWWCPVSNSIYRYGSARVSYLTLYFRAQPTRFNVSLFLAGKQGHLILVNDQVLSSLRTRSSLHWGLIKAIASFHSLHFYCRQEPKAGMFLNQTPAQQTVHERHALKRKPQFIWLF